MLNQSASSLVASVKQMIKHCRDIQDLLNTDKIHFTTNAINRINDSNKDKTLLIDKINALANDIHSSASPTHQSNSLLETIEKSAESLDSTSKRELNAVLAEFKSEMAKAYQSIITNSKIVFTNTQHMMSIWDKIQSCRSEVECVYDNKGNTAK